MPGVVAVWTAAELDVAPHHGFVKVHDDFARPPLAVDRVRFVGEADRRRLRRDRRRATARTPPRRSGPTSTPLPADHRSRDAPSPTARRADLPRPRLERGDVHHRRDRRRPRRDLRRRRARPLRQPADGRRADGARLLRGRSRPTTAASRCGRRRRCHTAAAASSPARSGWTVADVHIVTPQVGGGFGGKAGCIPSTRSWRRPRAALDRPVVWVPTRSEDMRSLPHSRGQVQYAELGCQRATARSPGCGSGSSATPAPIPASARSCRPAPAACPTARTTSPRSSSTSRSRVTNTTPMGAYRGAGRPEATALLERLVDHAAARARASTRSSCASRNFLGDDVFPFTTLTGNTYDSGDYRCRSTTAADARRLRRAARRAGGPPRARRPHAARHRRRRLRRDHRRRRRRASSARSRSTTTARRRSTPARRRTARATRPRSPCSSPTRPASRSSGSGSSTVDTDRRAAAAAAPAARARCSSAARPCTRPPRRCVEQGQGARRRRCSRPTSPTSWSTSTTGTSASPACRPRRSRGPSWPREAPPRATASPLLGRGRLRPGGRRRSRSAPTSPSSRSTPRPARSASLRHVAVDDCGTVLNPLLVDGQQHGGIAAGHRPGAVRGGPLRRRRQPAHRQPRRLRHAVGRRAAVVRAPRSTETPSPLNPLGAKGIGEAATIGSTPAVQNAVIDAARPPRRAPHRHAVHARAGVGGDPRRRGRHAARPVARAAGGVRRRTGQAVDEDGIDAAEGI